MTATIDRTLSGHATDLDAALYQASCFVGASKNRAAIILNRVVDDQEEYRIFPNDSWPDSADIAGYEMVYTLSSHIR